MEGTPPHYPALTGIGRKKSDTEITAIIRSGGGLMPALGALGPEVIRAIVQYLLSGRSLEVKAPLADVPYLKYMRGTPIRLFDNEGYPPGKPPWGTLNAISMDSGEILWQVPLGEFPELTKQGMPPTGTDNYGGPIVTAGGLVFIGATNHDRQFRAFDKDTGKILWSAALPAGGNATPATYMMNGRQFVVIAAGGGKAHFGKVPSASVYVSFALAAKSQ